MASPPDAAAGSEPTLLAVDPNGRPIELAASSAHEQSPTFTIDRLDEAVRFYAENGYVVVRGVIAPESIHAANSAFDREVKEDDRPYYRLSGRPDVHHRTEAGFMRDGLRDVQSLDPRRAPALRRLGTELVTDPLLVAVMARMVGRPVKVVQTMYFEGNPATQPHQDTYYLDSEHLGEMAAAWIAAEDVAAGAGRFFVAPGSHQADLPPNAGRFAISDHHDAYRQEVERVLRRDVYEIRAPALATGDVLIWGARTIHGSLPTTDGRFSRRSFTAHYIGDDDKFLQWQHRLVPLDLTTVNGTRVHRPKDLAQLQHRVRYAAEVRAPALTATAKAIATRRLLGR